MIDNAAPRLPEPAGNKLLSRVLIVLLIKNACSPRDVGLERDIPQWLAILHELAALGWPTADVSQTFKPSNAVALTTPTLTDCNPAVRADAAQRYAQAILATPEGQSWLSATARMIRGEYRDPVPKQQQRNG
jgi:hypothetical protein